MTALILSTYAISFMPVFSNKFRNNITLVTYKRFFPSVSYQVYSKCASAGKMLVTLVAFKWLFARVHIGCISMVSR